MLLCLIILITVAGVQVKGGYDKYKTALENMPLDDVIVKIEREYDKKDVLEFYVNGIYYGSGYYCIYDASIGYFDKEPKDMTDYECTLLAGIPNSPSVYSLDVRLDLAKQRQEKVVECMVEVKYITEDKAAEIIGDYK